MAAILTYADRHRVDSDRSGRKPYVDVDVDAWGTNIELAEELAVKEATRRS